MPVEIESTTLGTSIALVGKTRDSIEKQYLVIMSRIPTQYRLSPVGRRFRMRRSRPQTSSESQNQRTLVSDLLSSTEIDTVFDIHPGSCAVGVMLRQCGYRGRIITFEPDHKVWQQLRYCSMTDEEWLLSRTAISVRDDVLVVPNEGVPVVGTRLSSAIEVFCQDEEEVAVWLSRSTDGALLPDILESQHVRLVSIACSISDSEQGQLDIEHVLSATRQAGWEIVAVHSRQEESSTPQIADVLAVRTCRHRPPSAQRLDQSD